MGQYTDQLFEHIQQHLQETDWKAYRYKGLGVKGIHLEMPAGMEMSEPYQQRIWAILEQLPNIEAPRERVCLGIRKSGWNHYYQTVINPAPKDFQTVGMLSGWVTKEEWERFKADNFGSRQANSDE